MKDISFLDCQKCLLILLALLVVVACSPNSVWAAEASFLQASSCADSGIVFHTGKVNGLSWLPKGQQPKVVILCLHGASAWSGAFRQFGEQMVASGVATYAIDLPGFGPYSRFEKTWKRADLRLALPTVMAALEDIHARHPETPVFVLGESMGACVAIELGANCAGQTSGVVCSAPAWRVYKPKWFLARCALALLLKSERRFEKLVMSMLGRATDNPQLLSRWRSQPEYRFNYSGAEIISGERYLRRASWHAARLKSTPVMFYQSMGDQVVKPAATSKLFKRVTAANKTLILIDSREHLIFQENQVGAETLELMLSWMNTQMTSYTPNRPTGVLIASTTTSKARRLFRLAGISKSVNYGLTAATLSVQPASSYYAQKDWLPSYVVPGTR